MFYKKMNNDVRFALCAGIILLLCFNSVAVAGTTGRITGHITDSETGEGLPGANVILVGTTKGASTDLRGNFYINNIRPGIYDVTITMIGYREVTVKDARVVIDLSTSLNVEMQQSVLEFSRPVVVTAERPLVQKDLTMKQTTMTSSEIADMPLADIPKILATQSNVAVLTGTPDAKAGYNVRGIDDIRMRGGRNNEVALLIDGIKVQNPLFGGFGTKLNNNAIEQLTISSGGFSAEYGNALSGVINLTTRSGRSDFYGSLEYNTSNPFRTGFLASEQGKALNLQDYQMSMGGPVPALSDKLEFFFSAEVSTQAGDAYLFDNITWDDYRDVRDGEVEIDIPDSVLLPSSAVIAAYFDNFEDENPDIPPGTAQTAIVDSMQELFDYWRDVRGPDGRKINPFDSYNGWQGFGWNNSLDFFAKLNIQLTNNLKFFLSFSNDNRYRQLNNRTGAWVYGMKGQNVQLLTSRKETIKWNHTLNPETFYTFTASRFFESRRIRILKDYGNKYAGKYNVFNQDSSAFKRMHDYTEYAGVQAAEDPFEDLFYIIADNRYFSGDSSTTMEYRFDLTSQITHSNQLKAGAQFVDLEITRFDCQNISGPCVYPTNYVQTPQEGAIYIQDKVEFYDLVINVGGRLDYSNSGGDFWADPEDPLGEQIDSIPGFEYNLMESAKKKWKASPRVGMAYSITDKTNLHFNFGHFYQTANYRDLFRATGDDNLNTLDTRERSLIGGNIIGNPNLENEKSVQYEIGLQQELTPMIGLTVNLWLKETTNQVGSLRVPAWSDEGGDSPYTYSVFLNNNFGSARGVDVTLEKRYSATFSGRIDYTFSQARLYKPTSWDGYWDRDTKAESPKGEEKSPWDQPHVIRGNVRLQAPRDWKPVNRFSPFLSKLIAQTGLTVLYYGESGRPYTPTIDGDEIIEPYSARWPFFHQVDLRIFKKLNIGKIDARLYSEIYNLFDRENVLVGYSRTGNARDPGTSTFDPVSGRSSTYWDSRINNNFGPWRRLEFGLELNF